MRTAFNHGGSGRRGPALGPGLVMAIWAAPRVNAGAWFALAAAAPLALLGLGAAASQVGAPDFMINGAAGFWAAMLLLPAIVLAVRGLETQWSERAAEDPFEADLTRAIALTTGQAAGLLLVVVAGAKFTGESIALALAMAGVPLTLAVARDLWRRLVPAIGVIGGSREEDLPPRRNWTLEWAEAQARTLAGVSGAAVAPVMTLRPRPARVTLRVSPAPVDEAWMIGGDDRRRAA